MTLLHDARNGVLTLQVALGAAEEGISPEKLRVLIAAGKAILPRNRKRREVRPVAIGEGLRIKVNANVGSSRDRADVSLELAKMRVAVAAGADAGVFMTVPCGVTREALERLIREGRRLDIVSRGGSLLAEWMEYNGRENPFYEHFDRLGGTFPGVDLTD